MKHSHSKGERRVDEDVETKEGLFEDVIPEKRTQ